jgi:curved DNA-binding protein CbpA
MAARRTHYQVLGVPQTATLTEIRNAYRTRVRSVHPDSAARPSMASSEEMAAITQAWNTLSDHARRRMYDASLREPVAHASTTNTSTQSHTYSAPVAPARFPWRMLLGFVGIGSIVVVGLNIVSQPAEPRGPDGLISSGSCVVIDATQAAVEVSCDGEFYGVVEQLIGFDMTCRTGTESYRDRQGMGTACVVPS